MEMLGGMCCQVARMCTFSADVNGTPREAAGVKEGMFNQACRQSRALILITLRT